MFWNNFSSLCRAAGKAPGQVAAELGFSNATATHWKKGAAPRGKSLQKIADYFNVTINDLLSDNPPAPSKLHREQGEKIAVIASVGAGIPLEAIVTFDQDDPDAWEEIRRTDDAQYFALRIRGNSMEPLIRYGEIVIVRKQEEYNDGDIVIALVDSTEGVCKLLEYRDNGGICLRSLNPDYPPMIYNREQVENLPVRIMGRCVERRGKL